jgi:hypothetical protein
MTSQRHCLPYSHRKSREYGKQCLVVRADSGIIALESLRQLKLRASPFPCHLQVFSE